MKLHLPCVLRHLLISAMSVTCVTVGTSNTDAANMVDQISLTTYTDFGQNMGWYKTDSDANALLNHLRQQQGGVTISYIGGQPTYTMPHGMVDFTGVSDNGAFMSIGYNATASVQHNGVFAGNFTTQYVGEGHAVFYQGIEYRKDNSANFLHSPNGGYDNGGHDYKVTRMSKLMTDVNTGNIYSGSSEELAKNAAGAMLYHTGAGTMGVYSGMGEDCPHTTLVGAYEYCVGGVDKIESSNTYYDEQTGKCTGLNILTTLYNGHKSEPLPFFIQSGDSGSPVFLYNEHTGQYEYIGAAESISGLYANYLGGVDYTRDTLDQYSKLVTSAGGTLRIGAVDTAGEAITADSAAYDYDMDQVVSTTPYSGKVTGNGINVDFVGVQTGINTWKDLSSLRDNDNWYSYNNDFLNAAPYIDGTHATDGKDLTYADLFVTENLVFAAETARTNIVLDATVDLGIGYAQFSLDGEVENPLTSARFDIAASGNFQFNHAGYVIDKGVDVYTTLTGHQTLINVEGISSSYMFEWRKLGAGHLHIEGSGNNDIFLNVGGAGKTYLNRTDGYAAYNVLANTHTTVVITDIGQIYRDFTFGHQGGVLDMNGNSMVWNNANSASAKGFTIHALDEQAIVANLKSGSITTLTWTQGGAQTFLGSFADNGKDSALKFVYNAVEGASLTLNSIKTHLTHANSGIEVQSGTLTLVGTNTVHGKGSLTGTNADRYHSDLDWHYADATSNVTVAGGTFELGSHARLTGNVTVQDGGTFLMREGVQHAQEYVEGSTVLMHTGAIDKFYGLKGNVSLAAGGTMRVEYNEGVTVNNTYAGNISGDGAVSINLGAADAMFTLAGNNTFFTGSKSLEEGILVAANVAALGNVDEKRWLLGANGTLQVASGLTAANALSLIDGNSTGTLALTEDMAGVLDMSKSHANLFVGAEMGKKVQYGTANDTLNLNATSENKWNLGGGGGELVVNAALTGDGTLVLGNGQGLGGIVTLTNTRNSIGSITFNPGVTLSFFDTAALGHATIDLVYGSSLLGSGNSADLLNLVTATSTGSILLDRANNADFNLSQHRVSLGSQGDVTYAGHVTVAENAAYRFGGGTGTLTLTQALSVNGSNNLEIDGQGHSGSKVILGAASGMTGQVIVQGSAQGTSGDITLGFTVDNALASASSTTIEAGGIVDLGATTQTFTNMQVKEGGLLMGGEGSTVVFNMTSELAQYGSMQLDQAEKTGTANMILAGADNAWNLFTIKEGTVFTRVDNALSATGVTRVETGAALNMLALNENGFKGRIMQGNVVLAGGTLAADTGMGGTTIIFNGSISAETGMTGTITGGAKWVLNASENNRNGGTLLFNASRLELNNVNAQYIGGIFEQGSKTLALHSDGSGENMLKHFNSVNVASGKTLNITESSGNTIWQLDELTGAGTINWFSATNHSKTARLILGGEGAFSGTIDMNRYRGDRNRTHQAFIEITGENAVSGATINLTGANTYSQVSLAINADNVNVGNIEGSYAHIYAGAAPEDSASAAGHASTRKATLTITGSGDCVYEGTVGTKSDTPNHSLNITMAGSGTQSFEGDFFRVGDLTVQSGHLRVLKTSGSTFWVMGDVHLYQGGTLTFTSGWNDAEFYLISRSFINVYDVADLDASVSANFNTHLWLAGGTINFDAAALASGSSSALLNLSSVQAGAVNISFCNTEYLSEGEYYLVSGDWSALAEQTSQITLVGLPHLTGSFVADSSGLKLTLTSNADSLTWNGEDAESKWSETWFGSSDAAANMTGTMVFDDSASFTEVSVTTAQNVENMVFNASEKDYTLDATTHAVTTEYLYQFGSQSTTLLGDVNVTNATEIEKGELVITKAVEKDANGAYVSGQNLGAISGDGMLTIDIGGSTIKNLNITNLGTLNIKSGRYDMPGEEITGIRQVVVSADGSLYLWNNTMLNSQVELAGGTLFVFNSGLNGVLKLTHDSQLAAWDSYYDGAVISAAIDGAGHVLTKSGSGKVALAHDDVKLKLLNITGGTVQVDNQLTGIEAIRLNSNSSLVFGREGGLRYTDSRHTEVTLGEQSRVYLENAIENVTVDVKLAGSYAFISGGAGDSACGIGGTISTADVGKKRTLSLMNTDAHQWTLASTISDGAGTVALETGISLSSSGSSVASDVIISGNNSYSGGTNLVLGTITTSHENALGTGEVKLGGDGNAWEGHLMLNSNLMVAAIASYVDKSTGHFETDGILSLNYETLTVGAYGYAKDAVYAGSFNNTLVGSIAKMGTNTQEFSSDTAKVKNVSVQGGSLVFSSEDAQIMGDIEIGTESGEGSLLFAGVYTLDSDSVLSLHSAEQSTLGGLMLNGGVLSMLYNAEAEEASLNISGEVTGSALTIKLNGMLPTDFGKYLLVGGNFSNVDTDRISIDMQESGVSTLNLAREGGVAEPELTYSVLANDVGLYLVLSGKTIIWAGSDAAHTWSSDAFSVHDATTMGRGAVVVFDSTAENKNVIVTEDVSANSMSIIGGGYTFSGEGQISLSDSLDVSGGNASIIDKIDISGGTITVNGSELTIVQLAPTSSAATIQLTNAAKLTIGSADYRYGSFSGQVTGDAGSQLHLYTDATTDGRVHLLGTSEGTEHLDVYIHGNLALNLAAGAQNDSSWALTNVCSADLFMDANSTIFVRANEATLTPANNIYMQGKLTLNVAEGVTADSTTLTSQISLAPNASGELEKNGAGSITLSGHLSTTSLRVSAGTLKLTGSGNTVDGAFTIANGGTLHVAGTTMSSNSGRATINTGGTLLLGDNATVSRNTGALWLMGTIKTLENATATFTTQDDIHFYNADGGKIELASGSTLNLSAQKIQYWNAGSITLNENSTLNLTTTGNFFKTDNTNGTMSISLAAGSALNVLGGAFNVALAGDIGTSGGASTLTLAGGGTLTLSKSGGNTTQTVYSTLVVNHAAATASAPKTTILDNNQGGADNMYRTLSAVQIAAHNKLELKQTGGWNTIWDIQSLTGSGELFWNFRNESLTTSRLKLTGDNAFSGQITYQRAADGSVTWGRYYLGYLELAHDGAAKNAVVNLYGTENNGYAALAISAQNAQVQGINGSLAHIMSGAAHTSSGERTASAAAAVRPASTANNTLTIAGSDTYTYAGTVGKEDDTHRLSLAMTGTGSQTFSGEAHVGDVSVSNGALILRHADSKVYGDITVSGGRFTFAGDYTLGTGQTLSVLTSETVQLGGLELSGGALVFDAAGLQSVTAETRSSATAALGTQTATTGNTGSISLDFSHGLLANGTYKLASGDWRTVGDGSGFSLDGAGLHFGAALSLSGTADGLFLTYEEASNIYTWIGGASANWDTTTNTAWDKTVSIAGDSTAFVNSAADAPTHAVFDGGSANVTVGEAIVVDSMSILGGAQVTLGMSGEGASLSVERLLLTNGKLTLGRNGAESNWSGIKDITISQDGVLELAYGNGINNADDATDILLQGGAINLRNGSGAYTTLHADITVDGSGTIAGSLFGDYTTISGTITGDGTLTFAKELMNNGTNPITVSSAITDGVDGSLALSIKDTQVKLTGTNTYTGGTVIGKDGKLTITTNRALGGSNTNGVLGKLSGEGTLVLDLGSNNRAYATGTGTNAVMGGFTGTVDVQSGIFQVGAVNSGSTGALADFGASKVIVRDGATFVTHFGYGANSIGVQGGAYELGTDLDLMSGATVHNDDGNTTYAGNIRFNVKDDGTYNTQGTVKWTHNWHKVLTLAGLLQGDGVVELYHSNEANTIYKITGEHNTFQGEYKVVCNADGKSIKLHLGSETAAQYAGINLANAKSASYLVLDSNATIRELHGVAGSAVQASGAYTLTVSEGDFGGGLQNGTGTLALIKQGDGTLILRGANTYTGDTTITGGTLTLAHAGALASHVTVNEGALFRLEATSAKTFAKTISGAGSVEKTGAGTLTLTGAHSYTGDTTIKAGTLQLANAATLASNVVVNSGATFELNANTQAMTFGHTISGAGGVKKSGSNDVTFTQDHSYTGATTIEAGKLILNLGTVTTGEGEEAVTTNGIYTLDGAVSGAGTLEVSTGTTLKVTHDAHDISSALLVNGGEVEVTAVNGRNIQGNLTVQNGGKLAFTATTGNLYDGFVIDNSTHSLTLTNGTLDLGAMRHTFQNWSITMQDGSTIEGTGSSWTGSNNVKAALDVASNNMTISVLANSSESITGTNEISAATRLRGNTLKYNIAEGAALTVSGLIMTDSTNATPGIAKEGAGDLIFTRDHTFAGTTTISGGKLILDLGTVTTGEGEDAVTTNGIYTLDGTVSGAGTLQVNGGTTLQVNSTGHTVGTAVNLQEDAKWQIAAGGDYTLTKDVTGAGTLEVSTGTTLKNNSKTISSDLVLDGGKATLTGAQTIQGDITVNTGAALTFDASVTANDTLKYDESHKLTVNEGGVVDFASTSQTMGGWSIELNGGEIKGAGQSNWGAIDYHAALNDSEAHLIEAKTGDSVISADIRLRYKDIHDNKQDMQLKYDVGKDATLTMKGKVHSWEKTTAESTVAGYGSIIKEGEGKLIMTAVNTYGGTTSINEGTLELQGPGQIGKGNVSIASGAQLTAATTPTDDTESETWASISAAEGKTATVQGATITQTQTESSKTLNIAAKTADTQGTMTNSLVQIAAGASLTVDSMIISASSRLSGAATYATRAAADASELLLSNSVVQLGSNAALAGTQSITLGEMQSISGGNTTGALTLDAPAKVLTVSSDALSNLLVLSGSSFVVDFSGLLSGAGLADVDFVYLDFSGVSYADPAGTTISGLWNSEQLTAYYQTTQVADAAVPNVGMYFDVRSIPEPTSSTLSILALAALAARRRRK